jgi:hypothetical protein
MTYIEKHENKQLREYRSYTNAVFSYVNRFHVSRRRRRRRNMMKNRRRRWKRTYKTLVPLKSCCQRWSESSKQRRLHLSLKTHWYLKIVKSAKSRFLFFKQRTSKSRLRKKITRWKEFQLCDETTTFVIDFSLVQPGKISAVDISFDDVARCETWNKLNWNKNKTIKHNHNEDYKISDALIIISFHNPFNKYVENCKLFQGFFLQFLIWISHFFWEEEEAEQWGRKIDSAKIEDYW